MGAMWHPRTASRLVRTTLVVPALALVLAGCGASEDPEPSGARPDLARPDLPSVAEGVSQDGQPQLVNLVLVDGRVSGVPETVGIAVNTRVRLTVTADVADELVVEGYDTTTQLTVDEPVQLTLILDEPGEFPVSLVSSGKVLTTLRVS